jgi:hypothetical protein
MHNRQAGRSGKVAVEIRIWHPEDQLWKVGLNVVLYKTF